MSFGSTPSFELNQGLGIVREISSAIVSHELTQYNRLCCFQNFGAAQSRGVKLGHMKNAFFGV